MGGRKDWHWLSGQPLLLVQPCNHRPGDCSHDHGAKQAESVYRDAMGCDWMTVHEARQAIPPAYTEFLGQYLLSNTRSAEAS